jgi:hypothetical protein
MPKKRIVLLTREGAEHCYVANTLAAAIPLHSIIVDRSALRANLRRALRIGKLHFLMKAARSVFLMAIGDARSRKRTLKAFFAGKGDAIAALDKIIPVEGINSLASQDRLREMKPDVILVYGTSLVKQPVLDFARDLCINMHTGISPEYRGTACAFWPIVNGEFDMVGATVHECTSKVDGGMIYEIVRSKVERGDNLHKVFARAAAAGAEAYVRVVQRYLGGSLEGTPQDLSKGREYLGSDLTLQSELKARFRLALHARGF